MTHGRKLGALRFAVAGSLNIFLLIALGGILQGASGVPPYVPGHVLVRWREGAPATARLAAIAPTGWKAVWPRPRLGVQLLSVPAGSEIAAAQSLAALTTLVDATAPDWRLAALGVPDDPLFSNQWNMDRIAMPAVWDIVAGDPAVVIAAIDSGIDLTHPDLIGQFWANQGELPGNFLDDDGNGYVDDVSGWDFVQNDATPQDDYWHGTHVAGIIAASTDNGVGVAGVAPGVRLMSLKILDATGDGATGDLISALAYAADNGAGVANLSLAYQQPPPESVISLLQAAINEAHQQGLLVVAASGNQGAATVLYPAALDHVLAVGATTATDERWTSSSYGSALDLVAPGSGVLSTVWSRYGPGYAQASGTSMAAPHVSGLAGLLWSLRPHLSNDDVAALITGTVADVNGGSYPGWDPYIGWGRLDGWPAVLSATAALTLSFEVEPVTVGAPWEPARVTATLRSGDGQLAGSGNRLRFSAIAGYVTPTVSLTQHGCATSTLQVIPGHSPAYVSANFGPLSRTLAVPVGSGVPALLQVAAASLSVTVGGESSGVTATIRDELSFPVVDGVTVTFTSDSGEIVPPVATTTRGLAQATFFSGHVAGRVVVTASTGAGLSSTVEIVVIPRRWLLFMPLFPSRAQPTGSIPRQ